MGISELAKVILENNGATYNFVTGELNPATDFMASYENFEEIMDMQSLIEAGASAEILTSQVGIFVGEFLAKHIDELNSVDFIYLGAWVTGAKVYLDISVRWASKSGAINFAKANNQLAIYDNANKQVINL